MPRLDTLAVHAGAPEPVEGSVVLPIFQGTLYAPQPGEGYDDIRYPRLNNSPNHRALHDKLAALEGGEAALVTASGMAAISAVLLGLLASGDHVLVQRGLYGGTRSLLDAELRRFGVAVDTIDSAAPDSWAAALRPNTKLVYIETLSNPTLDVPDPDAIVAFAKAHGLVSVVDNTFASPVNFRPPERGFDLSVHSATKYLNGHSDLVAGAVIGRAALVEQARTSLNRTGGTLSSLGCFLLDRGLKTLGLRVRHQNASALALARTLEAHPAVSRVCYPGLESHPGHARAKAFLDGFGGMLAFELAEGVAGAERFIARSRLAACTPSLGGVETLVVFPARSSHRALSPEQRASMGIGEGLLRLSVGVEDPEDLLEDIHQALEA
ncbi:MAG: PLP-dependent transferase [Alphaproteobacteria bacterium]|nr:PLP-dependent transferase [Alphaproteobacteria bacterium]MCB9793976.1 PLP-dependent transferase [Alphaproteobacteria bacterium]